ncbi:unnamed protein product [Rotaria sordida]|uniref:Uncharacterized protein n=1 Tax=Rotaria sordida TaxID=392033 RepID=A0A814H6Z2_9BILA|nr:unnamed protein product [Rotaria sordida]CAF1106006.1 unnamed protein product [Rotaria sordida]CAF1110319.1 unnamed protein product [Rotaria sordida]
MNPNNTNSNNDQQFPTHVRRKKCHGNRRNQRFRKKCRAKGMKPKIIEKLLMKRNQAENRNHNNRKHTNIQKTQSNKQTTDINNHSKPTTINPIKRKRDLSLQETSQLSTSQPLSKKIYTRMISMGGTAENDEMSSLFSGRAACHLLAKQFELGLEDCDQAISINERNIDGYIQKW